MTDYLSTLGHLIKTAEIDEAKQQLSRLSSQPAREQQKVLEMLALESDEPGLEPLFKYILSRETHEDLLKRVIQTAGKQGLAHLIDDLAEFIFYDNKTLKTEAINALERIGTPHVQERLELVTLTDKCDQSILDALHRLKKKRPQCLPVEPGPDSSAPPPQTNAFGKTLALLASGSLKKRFQAFTCFSNQGSWVAKALKEKVNSLDHDLVVNLLQLTAKTIPPKAVETLLEIISQKNRETQIRFAAYNALNAFPQLNAWTGILKGASDPCWYVRMAAVKTLEHHGSEANIAEIKNKIESGTKTGEILVHTILDLQAVRLIEALMVSDTFSYITSNYLDRNSPVKVLEAFIQVLEKRNFKSTVKKYTRLMDQRAAATQTHFAVISPSPAFLAVYAKLMGACGYGVQTFTSTQKAFEAMGRQKPAVLVCDLFLNHMTGLSLAREVRRIYPGKKLPIVISSLQQHLDKPELDQELKMANVTLFCDFPARSSQIKSWVN